MSNLLYPPLLSTAITSTTQINIFSSELWGMVMRNEDVAATRTIQCKNGLIDASPILVAFLLALSESRSVFFPSPLYFNAGLRVVIDAGAPEIYVIWRRF